MTNEEEIHGVKPRPPWSHRRHRVWVAAQYDVEVPGDSLTEHLRTHALRTDGPFTLRSGVVAAWYLDARQTTFSGEGAWLVGEAVLAAVDPSARAVGGMTMGADPIAIATAMVAAREGRELDAFSIRKEIKDHGTGGRVVGPVLPGTRVAILEDTTTTGGAAVEAADAAMAEGLEVVQAIALVDRSGDLASEAFAARGIPYLALVVPGDLGVGE
jgi:orotate phosphoribosyltransferase